jgi:hypothetical protein
MLVTAIKTGFIKALKTAFMLLKIVLPIYALVVIFRYTPGMTLLQDLFSPAMKLFNLPGDAIMPIITGFFTDEYGSIAVMSQLNLSMAQITTVAMIVLVAHGIPVEAAIAQKIGLNFVKFTTLRIVMAILIGLLIGWMGVMFSW